MLWFLFSSLSIFFFFFLFSSCFVFVFNFSFFLFFFLFVFNAMKVKIYVTFSYIYIYVYDCFLLVISSVISRLIYLKKLSIHLNLNEVNSQNTSLCSLTNNPEQPFVSLFLSVEVVHSFQSIYITLLV